MASQIPEARSLATWEDAFQHPLPVVRKLEQQLRRNIEENRQKLRSLVGASYRDLLGTAERIIEMDDQIQHVEGHLGDVGRKCNARTVERVQQNHLRTRKDRLSEEQRRYGTLAQTKILQSALAVTLRIIKSGGDALLASKVLVLARLLHKSVADGEDEPPAVLEVLARKSRLARKKLLSYIARSLVRTDADRTYTVHSLCAYSMISSSAPRDVLRYFLQVRFAQLEAKTTESTPTHADLAEALELFRRTLADTRDLFPKRFADALSQISEAALVRDPTVRAVVGLNLDVYEQWIAEDVRNFKPWTHHEQVSLSEVRDALASWTKQAQIHLLEGLTNALDKDSDPNSVLHLRQRVLSRFLSFGIKFRDDTHIHAIEDVRRAFRTRLERLLEKSAEMADLPIDPQKLAQQTASLSLSSDVWSLAIDDFDLSGGATKFKQAVLQRENGRSDTVQQIADMLDEWSLRIQKASTIISSVRAARWDDDVEVDLDELDDSERIVKGLKEQDPQELSAKLQHAVKKSLRDTHVLIEQQASDSSANAAATFIRIVRELNSRQRRLSPEFAGLDSVRFDPGVIETLHRRLASSACDVALKEYVQRMRTPRHVPTALWEGSPALPLQPSPGTFKFLTTVHLQMSKGGNDLWSPAAVEVAKGYLITQLDQQHIFNTDGDMLAKQEPSQNGQVDEESTSDANAESMGESKESVADGRSNDANSRSEGRESLMQRTFDVIYLQRILHTSENGSVGLEGVVERLTSSLELEPAVQERLRKGATDYWRRTYLLFGLLAEHQKA